MVADPLPRVKSLTLLDELGDDSRDVIALARTVGVRAGQIARQVIRVADLAPLVSIESTDMASFKLESLYFGILRENAR